MAVYSSICKEMETLKHFAALIWLEILAFTTAIPSD